MHGEFGVFQRSVDFAVVLSIFFTPAASFADVVRDGSIGPDSLIQPIGPDFEILENYGELRGGNLFHSFQAFNLTSEQSATFSGSASIDNIISRVTGGGVSSIDGMLRSTVPGADLYLMNPNGVMFGPNAQLDVLGAFHASTAGELHFTNDGLFDADINTPTVLSLAPPAAFGFIGESAAPIELNGSLLISAGDIELSGRAVDLVNGASISTASRTSEPSGDITLLAAERVSLSGRFSDGWGVILETTSFEGGDAGSIRIEAPVIDLRDGAFVLANTQSGGEVGEIAIVATERFTTSGSNEFGWPTYISSNAYISPLPTTLT